MEFIPVDKDLLINPNMISTVEKKNGKIVFTMQNGSRHVVELPFAEVFPKILASGISVPQQFWAG